MFVPSNSKQNHLHIFDKNADRHFKMGFDATCGVRAMNRLKVRSPLGLAISAASGNARVVKTNIGLDWSTTRKIKTTPARTVDAIDSKVVTVYLCSLDSASS
jgi:hypothetical protein